MPSDECELRLPCVVICRPRDMAAWARLQSRGRLTPIIMFLRYRPSGAHRFSGPRPHILKIAPINILCRQHLSNSLTQKVFAAIPLPRISSINTARGRIVSKVNKTTSSILQIAFHNERYATRVCRRPIKMSLLCQIDMTLPRMFREVSGVAVRLMSDKELTRLEVLRDLEERRLTPTMAARLLGLERRQVFRLLKAYRAKG